MSSRPPGYVGPKISVEEAVEQLKAVGQEPDEEPEQPESRRERIARRARAGGRVAAEAARREAVAAAGQGRKDTRRATAEARRRVAAAIRAADYNIGFDELVDRRKKSRNQQLAERAQRAATIAPVTDHTLETIGTAKTVTEMARAGLGGAAEGRPPGSNPWGSVDVSASAGPLDAGVGTGVDATLGAPSVLGPAGRGGEPDWHDNPETLDPMNVGIEQEALFGHALVHKYADEPDHGGRTPAQLEAEPDLVVDAMDDFGFEHHSPLDVSPVFGLLEDDT